MAKGNPNPKYRFPYGAMNPRQLERKRNTERMFNMACKVQKGYIEQLKEKYSGIPIGEFLAHFGLQTGAREFTRKQYFKDFLATKHFERVSSNFKVTEKYYQEWINEQKELEKEG